MSGQEMGGRRMRGQWSADRLPDRLEIVPGAVLGGEVAAPASKSVTNRLLLLATLSEGLSVLRQPLDADDTHAMVAVATALGAGVSWSIMDGRPALLVQGIGGRPRVAAGRDVDCRLSGTAMRFGTAVAALADEPVTLTGGAPLLRRPIGPLVDALRKLGTEVRDRGGRPPVTVHGGLDGGAVVVDVEGSSQYASALLLAAPYARGDLLVRTTGAHAAAYVELTAQAMREWAARVDDAPGGGWSVTAGAGYVATDVLVEYDASAAAHLYGLAVATGGAVTVTNTSPTVQPDAQVLDVLGAFGATVEHDGPRVTVTGPDRPRPIGTVDLAALPDQTTTVAALAALADGVTTITGVEVVRGHETDRLTALATELRKLGTRVEERPDGLLVDGRTTRGDATLATHHDHRLAMAFAAVGARAPGVVLDDPACVAKTFPRFFDVMASLGATLREA